MTLCLNQPLRAMASGLLLAVLAACGGGASTDPGAAAAPAAAPSAMAVADAAQPMAAVATKTIQSTALNADGLATRLTVRAHANLAGGVGALLQVRVDGTVVQTLEVRAATPTDHHITVPALHPGAKVDLTYTNDASVAGVDRNLYISQVTAGDTYVLPTMPGVVLDRGTGAAAYDGVDVVPGQAGLFSNGALRISWPAPNMTSRLTVRASGTLAGNVGPQMVVRVDGVVAASTEVRASTPSDHTFAVPPLQAGSRVDVVYTNDEVIAGEDRNLRVHYLASNGTVLLPTAAGVVYDQGSGTAALDGLNTLAGRADMPTNGALRGRWPAPNMTDTLTVRAKGSPAGGVAPQMQVVVDSVLLGTVDVVSTELQDYSFAVLPMQAGVDVDVQFVNPGSANGTSRALNPAYAIAGKTVLLAADGRLAGSWPQPNLTDTITVRAKGTTIDNQGPRLQLLVDGVQTDSVELKSAEWADYTLQAPAMQPGRKLDLVLSNADAGAGRTRTVELAYLATANTFMLPTAAGSVFDSGIGTAALDGADTLQAKTVLAGPGALRTTWPQPNITSTLTVRASGTLAGNVGPVMRLWVDGIAVSSVEVRAATPTDYNMGVPAIKPGSKIAVTFDNPATVGGVQRQLNLAYLLAGTTVLKPSASGAVYSAGNLQATWPSTNFTDTLTVRAHGNLAGDVGPIMQVLVDGVLVGSTEVRSTNPQDYVFATPAIKAGTKIDLAYTNDGTANGVDRNLLIVQLKSGNTATLPNVTGATIDRGTGAAAFDGADVVGGHGGLYVNGALRLTWPEPNLTDTVTVRASSTSASGIGAMMDLRVDGLVVGTTEVRSTTPTDFVFAVPALAVGTRVDVAFTNAAPGRVLNVHYLLKGAALLLPAAMGNAFDLGEGLAAYDAANLQAPQVTFAANGALRSKWPAPNMNDSITVRASGLAAAGVAPAMQVRLDGVVLGTVNVGSAPSDFSFATLPVKPGTLLEVLHTNPGTADGTNRRLNLAYAINGTTVLRPTDAGVTTTAAATTGTWPAPNLTERITVRAKGTLAGNIGPIMQLFVDGVLLGSAEVRSTDWADYNFAAPPMRAGRKIDLVYTNDGTVAGNDRNLFIDHLVSGNTFIRSNAAGAVIDRGAGIAATDGVDTVAGGPSLYWPSAWRATWPEPNITSTLTVRASGTLAGNVGPVMRLWVDGIAVSSVEVRAATPTDYNMGVPAIKPGSKIAVTFDNPATVGGVQRQLNLAYLLAGTTVLKPSASGAVYSAGNLQATWPSTNFTDTLTVRAHGNLAGDVGPIMQVLVDGVLVGSTEVRSTNPQDYVFATPAIKAGTKIDLAYTNDGTANGVDRNLLIVQLKSGNTATLPNVTGATIDRGTGAAAFDGADVVGGHGGLYVNGALRLTWPEPNLTDTVTVRASSTSASGIGAMMDLRVDGLVVGTTEVRSTTPTDFVFAVPALAVGTRVDVAFTNAAPGRVLNVHYLLKGAALLLPAAMGNAFDLGEGLAAYDAANLQAPQVTFAANGALRSKWPAPNMNDSITVRASGLAAAGVAPAMQVRLDGVVLGTVNVGSAPSDFSFATLPVKPGTLLEVLHTNPGTADGTNRRLNLAYAINGTTVLRPTDAGVTTTAAATTGTWPAPNLTERITVRAKGTLAGNIGPIMQLFVDGVLLGSAEVRSTDWADYNFAAPPMRAGRKIDLVYTNDGTVAGNDRNLFIDHLVSGNTFIRSNAAGAVIDRGAGIAATDGVDTVAGGPSLYWPSAWRATWPEPNITSTLTVRASGTLAGNVGPVMVVRVDGVSVSSVEVRSTTLADYNMPVPPLVPGSKVDVIFANDGVVDGVDRNLQVSYLRSGSSYMLPTMQGVRYDLGSGNAALDEVDTIAGQAAMGLNGALRMNWPGVNIGDSITVRAAASMAANIGAMMELRVDGVFMGSVEVRSATARDYTFLSPRLQAGSRIDIAFVNDLSRNGEDRNLYVQYLLAQGRTLTPFANGVVMDLGQGEQAFDGQFAQAGDSILATNGSLRFTVPTVVAPDTSLVAAQRQAARLLIQAGFGPSLSEVNRVAGMSRAAWLAEQMAIPAQPEFVNAVQQRFNLGDSYRPGGINYTPAWVAQRFWQAANTAPDVLRKRVAFALHQILMVSMTDGNMYHQARAYANYVDLLNQHAFGNFRTLLEQVALTPSMGIYLSHMRNRPGDVTTGRMPDENFAREVMQLFSIGLHELNLDGTPRLDAQGNLIETYTNDDVMAFARVFTGYSWAFPDGELTETRFRWGNPTFNGATDHKIDLKPMRGYPGMHSMAEKRLFAGKGNALVIPANTPAADSLRLALDTLFNHPNVGPFISRQLIQRLVSSHPSPSYVARVASVFNNNGQGVRGDLGAVVRAILLDAEAVAPPVGSVAKLREPVLRVGNWLRSTDATSITGQWQMAHDLDGVSQKALYAPSVFGYFRPGYVPPNSSFSTANTTVPELQIVNESTTAQWVNTAMAMAGEGLGWTGTSRDVKPNLQPLADLAAAGAVDGLIERLNLLLYAGRMSTALKQELLLAITSVTGNNAESHLNRARVALFLALASPEYMVQP